MLVVPLAFLGVGWWCCHLVGDCLKVDIFAVILDQDGGGCLQWRRWCCLWCSNNGLRLRWCSRLGGWCNCLGGWCSSVRLFYKC